jgi:hypothetical protein
MNIFFIGPGNDPLRLGTYFCNKARADGHSIKSMSHRSNDNQTDSTDHVYCSYHSQDEVTSKFEKLIEDWTHIDLMFYNSTGGWYPGNQEHYKSDTTVDVHQWHVGLDIHCVVPHILTCKSLNLMNENSKIIYMTSSASYLINRDNYLDLAGYFGLKGVQNQLMRAFAAYNDKDATVTTFAPHIPYDESIDMSVKVMDSIYNKTFNLTENDNGKIIQFYPPEGNPHYHD